MYTCNACCEASTQTNLLLLSLFLGGPNPFGGGGGHETGSRDHICVFGSRAYTFHVASKHTYKAPFLGPSTHSTSPLTSLLLYHKDESYA